MRLENQIKMLWLEVKCCKKQILLSYIIIFGLLFITFYLMLLSELSENAMYEPIQDYYQEGADLVLQDVSYKDMLEIEKLPVKNIHSYYFAENEVQGNVKSVFAFFYSDESVNGQPLEDGFFIKGREWSLSDNEKDSNGYYHIWIDNRLSEQLGITTGDIFNYQEKYAGSIPCQVKGIYKQGCIEEQCLLPFCMGQEILDKGPYYHKCGMQLKVMQLKNYSSIISDLQMKGIIVEKDEALMSNIRTILLLGKMTWIVSGIMIVVTAFALRQCMNIIFFDRRRYMRCLRTLGMRTKNIECVYIAFMQMIIMVSFSSAAFFAHQKAGNNREYKTYLNEHTRYLAEKFGVCFIFLEAIFFMLFLLKFYRMNRLTQIYDSSDF